MKFKYILLIAAFTAATKGAFAQYSQDAIRYSTFQPGSTSRVKGIGNAGTAIGGDLSSIGNNPAGLGFFTKSESSFTPELDLSSVKSSYFNQAGNASKATANISNISWEFYNRLNTPAGQPKDKGWLSVNFGFGYNRTNDYNESILSSAKNNTNSITDYYASLANQYGTPDNSLQSWAYAHNLIDLYGTNYASNAFTGNTQLNNIVHTGSETEFDIAMGTNYSNKLYLGLSLNFTTLDYNSVNNFNEVGVASVLENGTPVNRNYNSTYSQIQHTTGNGVNLKFGAIYKPVDAVRIGAVITTPTAYSIDDSFNEGLNTSLSNGSKYSNGPVEYPLSYTLTTPFKAAGGISIFMGQAGFITGDVEYINYASTKLHDADGYTSSIDNNTIQTTYRSTVNTRLGAEIRLPAGFMLRGGYGILGSPLKSGGADTKMITGGLGYHIDNYYVDLAYMNIKGQQTLTPYTAAVNPAESLNKTNNNLFLTIGFRY